MTENGGRVSMSKAEKKLLKEQREHYRRLDELIVALNRNVCNLIVAVDVLQLPLSRIGNALDVLADATAGQVGILVLETGARARKRPVLTREEHRTTLSASDDDSSSTGAGEAVAEV